MCHTKDERPHALIWVVVASYFPSRGNQTHWAEITEHMGFNLGNCVI